MGDCAKWQAWLWLVVGVLFLVANLSAWNFWGIEWYTAAFILFALGKLCCCGTCKPKKK